MLSILPDSVRLFWKTPSCERFSRVLESAVGRSGGAGRRSGWLPVAGKFAIASFYFLSAGGHLSGRIPAWCLRQECQFSEVGLASGAAVPFGPLRFPVVTPRNTTRLVVFIYPVCRCQRTPRVRNDRFPVLGRHCRAGERVASRVEIPQRLFSLSPSFAQSVWWVRQDLNL